MIDQLRWCMCFVDACIIKAIHHALKFLNEWFSISQNSVERAIIAVYIASCICSEIRKVQLFLILLYALNVRLMWNSHRVPQSTRIARMSSAYGTYARWMLYALGVFVEAMTIFAVVHSKPHEWELIVQTTALFFGYTIAQIPGGGERGKRRKAALAKVKELFGTSWIVAPLPQVQ